MKKNFFLITLFILTFSASIFAQFGNADPEPINFARGKTSKTIYSSLKEDWQQDYAFSAVKGQRVKISIKTNPAGKTSFKIIRFDGKDYKTMTDRAFDFTFIVPDSCEYYLTVIGPGRNYKKYVKFALTLKITN